LARKDSALARGSKQISRVCVSNSVPTLGRAAVASAIGGLLNQEGGRVMKLSTVIVGLLLAFLLFTPLGREIGMILLWRATQTARAPDPAKVAARTACETAWFDAGREAAKARKERLPSFNSTPFSIYKNPQDLVTGKPCSGGRY
jgi:hypothetical protein